MTAETWVGFATLVIALGTILWQLSATLTGLRQERKAMSEEITEMKEAISELRTALSRLDLVPLHDQRLTQLEKLIEAQQKQIATLWQKVFSIDRHVAVVRAVSSHDLSASDTDRPPKEDR